jgi:hypothetical protein
LGVPAPVLEQVLLGLGLDPTNVGKPHKAWFRLLIANQRRIQVVPGLVVLILATLFSGFCQLSRQGCPDWRAGAGLGRLLTG